MTWKGCRSKKGFARSSTMKKEKASASHSRHIAAVWRVKMPAMLPMMIQMKAPAPSAGQNHSIVQPRPPERLKLSHQRDFEVHHARMCCRDIIKESATNTSETNVHLLLVDDSPVALAYLEAMFRGAGYSVDTATHGGEAFEKATRTVPNLVVTDGLMPDVDGYELIRRLREHPETAAVPVIMLTSADAGDPEHLGRTSKPDAIILKSMQFDPLLNEVKRLLDGKDCVGMSINTTNRSV